VKCLQEAEILFKDTILQAQRKYIECIKKRVLKDPKKATVIKDQSEGGYYK